MNIPIGNKVNKMDRNQYENEFGGVPQKPFTERSESAQPYQEQPYQAQPYQEQLPQEQPPQAYIGRSRRPMLMTSIPRSR